MCEMIIIWKSLVPKECERWQQNWESEWHIYEYCFIRQIKTKNILKKILCHSCFQNFSEQSFFNKHKITISEYQTTEMPKHCQVKFGS